MAVPLVRRAAGTRAEHILVEHSLVEQILAEADNILRPEDILPEDIRQAALVVALDCDDEPGHKNGLFCITTTIKSSHSVSNASTDRCGRDH